MHTCIKKCNNNCNVIIIIITIIIIIQTIMVMYLALVGLSLPIVLMIVGDHADRLSLMMYNPII